MIHPRSVLSCLLVATAALPGAVLARETLAAPVAEIAARHGFAGEVLVAKGSAAPFAAGYGGVRTGQVWRLASIAKQVSAALIVRDHLAALDRPVAGLGTLTLRHLLTHHTGLANPDDTPRTGPDAMPAFYTAPAPDLAYCRSRAPTPGAAFAYNNCDTLLAAQAFLPAPRWPAGMRMARPGETGVPGTIGGRAEPPFALASWGAAGGLVGTLRAVWRFDRALMTGRMTGRVARDALWQAEGGGSYQALGAWVFPGVLAGCAKPVRIVQRDGEIAGVQARNFILPDADVVVIAFTNRSSDDFSFGEVWQQSGFAYDLLSAAACGDGGRKAVQ